MLFLNISEKVKEREREKIKNKMEYIEKNIFH